MPMALFSFWTVSLQFEYLKGSRAASQMQITPEVGHGGTSRLEGRSCAEVRAVISNRRLVCESATVYGLRFHFISARFPDHMAPPEPLS